MQSRIQGIPLQMNLSNIEVKKMEEKKLEKDYQKEEKEQCCCRYCETRDKDMTEFYIIRIRGN
jgi:hypothetical protein